MRWLQSFSDFDAAASECSSVARSLTTSYPAQWLRAALASSLFVLLPGCATVIVPPTSPTEPLEVFVVDHGRTSSLVIPSRDGGMLRYAYGDWNYYALGKDNIAHGLAALLWPTQGALGRAQLDGPATIESIRNLIPSIQSLHAFLVEHVRVEKFSQDMEALYHSQIATEVENAAASMRFVHHPRPYTCLWNSNHAIAAWLRELGATTRGLAFRATWRVRRRE